MSDPLSVTASVVGIIGALLHGSKRLYEFIDALQNAPKDIAALSTDLRALYEILAHITNVQDRLSSSPNLCVSLKAPLENCLNIFNEFTTLLQGFTQTSRDGIIQVRFWKQMVWAFKDKEIQLFRDTITTYKVSLDMALNVIAFSTITSLDERTKQSETEFKEEFKAIRSKLQSLDNDLVELASFTGCKDSEWYGTEADFALRRFLEYTEPLCDSPPASFPGSPTQPPSENYDGLDTQAGIQDEASSCQLNDVNSTMSLTGKQSLRLHIDTVHRQLHHDLPSIPGPELCRRAVAKLSHSVSDHATPSALNDQSPSFFQQPVGSSQEPINTDLDLKICSPMHAPPDRKRSHRAMNQVTEVDQPINGRLFTNASTKILMLKASCRPSLALVLVGQIAFSVSLPLGLQLLLDVPLVVTFILTGQLFLATARQYRAIVKT
ncbi:hypothetical protein FOVSG1_008395 [Fusarium oxysporum f. sp. vasinfectum]